MITVKALNNNLKTNKYLTGFYSTLFEANTAVSSFQNKDIFFEIVEIKDIKTYPFYIIEVENEFCFFQNERQISLFIDEKQIAPDEDGIYFILYSINKNYLSNDGTDNMGSWEHHHISKFELDKINSNKFLIEKV